MSDFEMPNHNKLIYQFAMQMLENQRSVSVTYDTFESGKDLKEEHIIALEIRTNKRSIKARY